MSTTNASVHTIALGLPVNAARHELVSRKDSSMSLKIRTSAKSAMPPHSAAVEKEQAWRKSADVTKMSVRSVSSRPHRARR